MHPTLGDAPGDLLLSPPVAAEAGEVPEWLVHRRLSTSTESAAYSQAPISTSATSRAIAAR